MLKRNCRTASTLSDLSLELSRFVHAGAIRKLRALSKRIVIHPASKELGYAGATWCLPMMGVRWILKRVSMRFVSTSVGNLGQKLLKG